MDNGAPPFAIGADSGHGAAHYFEGARPVPNLVLPEKKRAKLAGSETSTPGAPRMHQAQLPSFSNIEGYVSARSVMSIRVLFANQTYSLTLFSPITLSSPTTLSSPINLATTLMRLENFDFDSFLRTGDDNDAFDNLVSDFDFPNEAEV